MSSVERSADPTNDPSRQIAVVGMAGRFPGAPDVASYWQLLMEGREAVGPIPAHRWDTSAQLDPAKVIPSIAAMLEDVDQFDPTFFGISPREAADIDPQQRLMLEVAWQTLEHAGVPAKRLFESRTGVYFGALWNDYANRRKANGAATTQHTAVGNALDIIAARVSFFLKLRGPSLVVETGCSSSLVALHLAAQALRAGEIDSAIVGGVNLILVPDMSIGLTYFGGLSPDGHCRAFSAEANGFVRGEGAISMYVKRLDDALADGDRIYGIVAATAVNNDGGGHSIVSPNTEAQESLLRGVYDDAGIPLDKVAYIEAHGTGTLRGDPIEAGALGRAIGQRRGRDAGPLAIGSAKTNIGHLEAAAGMAGLVKTIMALHHRVVPASLHAQRLNPEIPFAELNLRVATEQLPLPADEDVYAGVNSFGWGGTNAHIVLRTPPSPAPVGNAGVTGPVLLPVSAHNDKAISTRAAEVAELITDDGLATLAGTLAWERDHFPTRAAFVGEDAESIRAGLAAFVADPEVELPGVVTGRARATGRTVFVLPGQGSQWAGMGKALYARSATFRAVIERCAAALAPHVPWNLVDVISGAAGDEWMDRIDSVQPTLWAMSVGIAELWREAGVEPDVVIGHSQGEITAATIAGLLSYEDGALIMARRSALAQRTAGKGRMLAVDLDLESAKEALEGFEDSISLAVNNGPTSCVLSGDIDAVLTLKELLDADGTFCRLVNVDYASHSHHMDELTEDLREALASVAPRAGGVELMSTVRVHEVTGPDLGAEYWVQNLRRPVLFADAMTRLFDEGVTHVVEISPHPVLTPAIEQLAALRDEPPVVLTSLRRDTGTVLDLTHAFARAYVTGLEPFGGLPRRPGADVPTYPWQRERYWITEGKRSGNGKAGLEFEFTPSVGEGDTFDGRTELSVETNPWLADHKVHEAVVLPGAAMMAFALSSGRVRTGAIPGELVDVRFASDLTLGDAAARLGAVWREDVAEGASFTLLSLPQGTTEWTEHASARVGHARHELTAEPFPYPLVAVPATSAEKFYASCSARGLNYGPAFQGLTQVHVQGAQALGKVVLPKQCAATLRPGGLHPALWDAALQVSLALVPGDVAVVPVQVARVRLGIEQDQSVTEVWSHAVRRADGRMDVTLFDPAKQPLLTMEGLAFQVIEQTETDTTIAERVHRLEFHRAEVPVPHQDPGSWIVCGAGADGNRAATALVAALERAGAGAQKTSECPSENVRGGSPVDGVVFVAPSATDGLDEQRKGLMELTEVAIAIAALPAPPRLVVVSADAQAVLPEDRPDPGAALYWGFTRVLRREHSELGALLVDVRARDEHWADACAAEVLADDGEDQVALRGAERFTGRLVRGEPSEPTHVVPWRTPAQPFQLRPDRAGFWDHITFRPMQRCEPGPGEVEIEVGATALNFIDVMKAMGTYPDQTAGAGLLGGECAGRISKVGPDVTDVAVGDRVVGCGFGAIASHVIVRADHTKPIPDGMDDAAAAGIPLVTVTAWYSLVDQADLQPGETVLIHSAAGGLGLAAIGVAKACGANVIATAGTERKRAYLRRLGITHVLDSRDLSWADQVHVITEGRGVDVVLNSLTGAAIPQGLAALAEDGRFIEVGKKDIYSGRNVSLSAFAKGVSFAAVDVAGLITRRPPRFAKLLDRVWREVTKGALCALPVSVHPFGEAAEVLRTMSHGSHIGKLVLADPSTVVDIAPQPLADGRFRSDGSYLLTGGLGALGLSLAEYLAEHGAGALVLLGRSEPDTAATERIEALRAAGTAVRTFAVNVADRDGLADVLAAVRADLPPLRGVFHAAGVLDDAMIDNLTAEQAERVLAPKVDGARHLDELTTGDPLDAFVMFSSVAGLIGNIGQAPYAAGNVFMDALAEARRRRGQPALAVQWGPFDQIGLAAQDDIRGARLAERGMTGFTADQAWAALSQFLDGTAQVVSYVPIDLRQWFDAYPDTAAQATWRVLREAALAGGSGVARGTEFLSLLRTSAEVERPGLVESKVREVAGRVLRLDPKSIDRETPFKSLGLDSLMGLELRNRLEATFGLKLSPTLLWTYGTAGALSAMLQERLSEAETAEVVPG